MAGGKRYLSSCAAVCLAGLLTIAVPVGDAAAGAVGLSPKGLFGANGAGHFDGDGMIDQQVGVGLGGPGPDLSIGGPHGQGFVPSVAEHWGMQIGLSASFGGLTTPANVTLRIREGSVDGPVVAGTEVTLPLSFQDGGAAIWGDDPFYFWIVDSDLLPLPTPTFWFEAPVTLIPGELYVIEMAADGPVRWTKYINSGADPYHAGEAIINGQLQNTILPRYNTKGEFLGEHDHFVDFAFRTIVVPEPMSGALLLLAAGAMLRRRTRNVEAGQIPPTSRRGWYE